MEVEARLFAGLTKYLPPSATASRIRLELPEGTTVADLAARLGMGDEPIVGVVTPANQLEQAQSVLGEAMAIYERELKKGT